MLLRSDLYVRSRLRVSRGVRVREREREREEGEPVKAVRASAAALPDPHGPASPSLPRELLVLLAEQRPAFLGFVRKRVRSGADAEDLLQQALLKATEKLDSIRDGERVAAWFYRVLRTTIADHHAAWARRESRLELLAREASEAPPAEAAVCGCSLGVLDTLHAEYGEMLRRVDVDEESLGEVARSLAITPNNAKVRLHRARKALRAALLSYCGTDSTHACASCAC
jgi:RNA polymerase sigma-70 factor (ECF subfamily)